jgi:hypothetical protein
MRRVPKTLITLAGALLLSTLGVVAVQSPASAAVCSGRSCAGDDPVMTGCADNPNSLVSGTRAVTYGGIQVATVWNYYTSTCTANWARGQLTQQAYDRGYQMQVQIGTTDSSGNPEATCFPGPSDTGRLIEDCYSFLYHGTAAAYTDMVDGTNVTTATVSVYDANGTWLARAHVNL